MSKDTFGLALLFVHGDINVGRQKVFERFTRQDIEGLHDSFYELP